VKNYLEQTFDFADPALISSFDEMPLWSSYFGAVLLDTITFKDNAKILDIGCGAGYPLLEIAMRFGNNSQAYGIDPWKTATKRLKYKAKIMGVNNITIINGLAEKMPFEDNYFDLIVSNNGLNNCEDQLKVLAECYRTMKPGGQLVFTVNLPGSMKEFYSVFEKVLEDNNLLAAGIKMKEHIKAKRKTIQENLGQIKKNKFVVKKVIQESFFMRYLDGTSFLNHHFIKLAFLDSWVKVVPVERKEELFAQIEARLNKYAKAKGELKLTIPFVCIECIK
jgi:ubiquinone/menaquinone biosynthesis C-methylase UbiE